MQPSRLERWIEMGDDLDGFKIASYFDIIKCNTVKFVVVPVMTKQWLQIFFCGIFVFLSKRNLKQFLTSVKNT